ncbi:MAG: hypothetical protein KF799_13925 [Bdellovibrionales bacterium]|nr:hypothetical protein [Bdellovibrionales bacterium]
MKTAKLLAATIGVFAIHAAVIAEETVQPRTLPDVLSACKNDCKKATSAKEAHECAEKKGRLNKQFRDSSCYKVNEEYEKAIASENK